MERTLQKILFILAGLSVLLGFLAEHDPVFFWWHHLPFLDGMVGGAGAILLILLKKLVASFASRKEDFYD